MKKSPTYHIIGGGVAGLFCACFIKQKQKKSSVYLYEMKDFLGGRFVGEFDQKGNLCNMLHIVSSGDKHMARFAKEDEWKKKLYFFDYKTEKVFPADKTCLSKCTKIFGITKQETPYLRSSLEKIFRPFLGRKRRFWFANKELNQRIINVLSMYIDKINFKFHLKKIIEDNGKAVGLKFDQETISLDKNDVVIIALDNINCKKILDVPTLKHSGVLNIIYQTSQTIFLPYGVSFLGIKNGTADWIYSDNNTVTAVINGSISQKSNLNELPQKIWKELDKIRNVNSAFVPPYKILYNKNAVALPDKNNNEKKPLSEKTKYKNVFVAGDWTIKDEPCRLETAAKSALRAVKAAVKMKYK